MQRTVSSGAWWLSPTAAAVASLAPAIVAVFVCAHQLTLHGVLHGVVISGESQNLASSIALTHGALPYSDYPLAQPPGMLIAMLPFSLLSHVVAPSLAMSIARGATAVATVIAVYFTGFAARGYGVPASVLAGVFAATYPLEFFSTAGVTVGPYVLMFTMIGIAFAFREGMLTEGGRLFAAALFIGIACTIKPWAFIPAVLLFACSLAYRSEARSHALPAAGGLAVGIVLPCIVFLLAAPGKFWHDVVVTELPGHGSMATGQKLTAVLGLGGAAGYTHVNGLATVIAIVIIAAVLVVAFLGIKSSSAYDWFVTLSCVGVLGAVFLPGSMSLQYGEFALPLVAVGVAVTASRLLGVLAAAARRASDLPGQLATAFAIILIGCAAVVTAISAPADGSYGATYADSHAIVDTGVVSAKIAMGSCAISNNPMLLVASDRFFENGSACPVTTDPAGLIAIDRDRAHAGRRATVKQWITWASQAHYFVIVSPTGDIPLAGRLDRYLHRNFGVQAVRHGFLVTGRPLA
jgi:hypothetical protein